MIDTHPIEMQAMEANSAEHEEFMKAVAELESDPVQALRDWYIAKGEAVETELNFPEFFKPEYIPVP